MEDYKDSDYVKIFRHLATHLDAYFFALDGPMSPKQLKDMIMDYARKPESTARAMVKDLTGSNKGLFNYDEEKNLLLLDKDLVDQFYENIDFLLDHESQVKRIKKENAELEECIRQLRSKIWNLEKLIGKYRDTYGDIDSSSDVISQ